MSLFPQHELLVNRYFLQVYERLWISQPSTPLKVSIDNVGLCLILGVDTEMKELEDCLKTIPWHHFDENRGFSYRIGAPIDLFLALEWFQKENEVQKIFHFFKCYMLPGVALAWRGRIVWNSPLLISVKVCFRDQHVRKVPIKILAEEV